MDVGAIIGIIGGVAAVLFGYAAFRRNTKTDEKQEGKESGAVMTELGYVKAGIDDIKQSQKEAAKQHIEVITRLTAVESSAKQAHHRIDRLECDK